MSFCEVKRDAALAVAEAVADKAELEKLDLNGKGGVAPAPACWVGPMPILTPAPFPASRQHPGRRRL